MKKTLSSKLLLILILLFTNTVFADDIWTKDFSSDLNKGYWGNGSDMIDVVDWTLDVTNCDLEDDADYVKVVETSGGRLEAVDCDGEAVWESRSIDISNFTNCAISIITAETGTSTNDEKYIKCFYKLDGGSEIAFDSNAANIGNWDNSEALVSGLNASSLVIVVRLNNPLSSNKVYFDDIIVSGEPVVIEADRLTEINLADNPVVSQTIDSKTDTPEEAISCFLFDIDETDAATDGNSTTISRITFFNSNPDNSLDWQNSLGGLLLFASGSQFTPENISITADSIFLDFTKGQIEIPDGEKVSFDLRCYLNSANYLEDGKTIGFKIAEDAKGFEVFNDGSDFRETNPELKSAVHKVDVEASELIFADISDNIERNQYFTASVFAVDTFQNIDKDYTGEVNLSLYSGNSQLFSDSDFTQFLSEGKAIFDSLYYQKVDTIQLLAESEPLPNIISDDIIIYNTFNSEVISANWSPADTLLSSLWIAEEDRKEVFRFSVFDGGEDGVSTYLKNIRIQESENNQLDWDKSIGEFYIVRNNVDLEAVFSFEDDFLEIEFADSESGREIASDDSAVYSIYCYLKKGKITDGEILQMQIDKSGENWAIDSQGSGLKPEFTDNITGPEFICDVIGTEMKFSEIPKSVNYQEEFLVEIELLDQLGNIDTNSKNQISLSIASGTGNLTSSSALLREISEGRFIWNDLIYDKAENFTLQAESEGLKTILSDNISGVDNNSTVTFTEVINQTTLNPLSTNQELAIPVLNFKITDSGDHDELPTTITSLRFYKEETVNSFNWRNHIAGAVIKSDGKIIASTTDIEEDYLRFNSSKGLFEIANSSEQDFQLCIYFRKSQLPDNKTFQIKIPKEDYEWKTGSNSSKLSEVFDDNIVSEIFHIEVEVSKLSFISTPYLVSDSSDMFSVKIAACDANENIDTDASLAFDLDLISGDGSLKYSEPKPNIENGIAEINSLKYIGDQVFSMELKSEYLGDTCLIFMGEDAINIYQDFESSNLDNWQNSTDWTISSYEPISGNYSLKHNLTNQNGTSYITGEITDYKSNSGNMQWTFVIRNGEWDPSSGNSFQFHLFMNNSNPHNADIKYSVGVNLSGTNDILTLWKTEKDKTPEQLISSDFNWNEFENVAVQVEYQADGTWVLTYNRLGESENWLQAGTTNSSINTDIQNWFYGLQFNFETASRAGDLWFDDLKIESGNTVPFIKSYDIVGRDSIVIYFSEDIDNEMILSPDNFKLTINDIEFTDYSISEGENQSQVLLLMSSNLETGDYVLDIFNITDIRGAINKKDSVAFEYLAPANMFDVVINEIMADPSPTNGLPEYEFIELYNTQDYPVSIENWSLKVGEKKTTLLADTIAGNSYLILCSTASAESFAEYGNVLSVTSFPGLTNSGSEVEILSAEDKQIDKITYSDSWYKSVEKEDGGWSLERIDPLNTCSTYGNYSASINEKGGTPGSTNSIYRENIDESLPQVNELKQLSANQISIDFSEYMDTLSLKKSANYSLESNTLSNLELKSAYKVELSFENIFTDGELQQLSINNLEDECGNVLDTVLTFTRYSVHQYDVVINEIMADPSPGNGLPEYEFIELYNTQDYPVSLENWSLKVGEKKTTLPVDTIAGNSYLILCSTAAAESFAEYGNVLSVTSFPGLTNSGSEVEILSAEDKQIDKITYSDSWYKSVEKEDGGWSLERIDPLNTCSTYGNYSASINEKGGTPGSTNSIYRENIDESLPQVNELKQLSANQISIDFSEYMDTLSLKKSANYSLESNTLSNLELKSAYKVELSFENIFTDGELQQLSINNLEDECGNVLDTVLTFTRYSVHQYDVVINEIMADPSPTNGLPEFEFIELYNTKDYPVSLENWSLKVGEKKTTLPADTIVGNSYLILCSTASAESFAEYGNVLSVTSFPGLTNSGSEVEILSAEDKQIDKITYSDSWYKSAEKEDGGWSLERIDPLNISWQEPNWLASVDINGGTPGKINSVDAENRDQNSPGIEKLVLISSSSITILFSEPMDLEGLANLKNIELLPDSENPIEILNVDGVGQRFDLYFQADFIGNSRYKIIFSDAISDLAGNSLSVKEYEFWVPLDVSKGDIIINEVLFNPISGGSDYVELYNVSDKIIDLSKVYLAKRDENLILIDSVKVSDNQLLFYPNSFILLSADTVNILENYYTSNPEVFHETKIPNYSDKEGRVVLLSDFEIIDDFAYKEEMHFDLLASVDGVALERINPNAETNNESNWQSAAQNIGFGTPGLENSVYDDIENEDEEVSLSTKIFSPDNDGKDDRLYIIFNLQEDAYVVNIRIYNSIGKEVRKLASNLYLASEDKVHWDGLGAKKERLAIGIYMIYIELFNADGEVKSFKKTCVLGGKF